MKKTQRMVEKCRLAMSDSAWWDIPNMAARLECTETGASARIRDLRKVKYGAHKIVKKAAGSIFLYRMESGRKGK